MAAKTRFRGSFTALVTPFKNGAVDEKAFRELVEWQIAEGTNDRSWVLESLKKKGCALP